ncbi:MAG: hypothetical protein MZV65_25560 [Chromatiales bacterium]|nr:hypothetical protein [Chromatiales bacterium]
MLARTAPRPRSSTLADQDGRKHTLKSLLAGRAADPLLLPGRLHARVHEGSLQLPRPAPGPDEGQAAGGRRQSAGRRVAPASSPTSTSSISRCWPTRTRSRSRPTTWTVRSASACAAAPT